MGKNRDNIFSSGTLLGIILGCLAIFGAFIWEGGTLNILFMWPAMLIVFGGTLAAGIAGTSLKQVRKIPLLIKVALFPRNFDSNLILEQIVEFAAIARRKGFLVLDDYMNQIKHPFLKKLIRICIDGADSDSLQKIVDLEVHYITERHNANIQLFVKLGGYSPTMGIIGTVMGLISTLAAAGSDPTILIHHIASAFIATMWGIFMANIIWLPLGDKLRTLHHEEMQLIQLMFEGTLAIQSGEIPSLIRARLAGAFPLSEQEEIMKRHKEIHIEATRISKEESQTGELF